MNKKISKIVSLLVIAAFLLAGVLYVKEQIFDKPDVYDNGSSVSQNVNDGETVTDTGEDEDGQQTIEQGDGQEAQKPEPDADPDPEPETDPEPSGPSIDEDGHYTSKEEVALYLHLYGRLPDNFITKNEAYDLGWDSGEGNLDEVAPGMSIGGSKFGNYEGLLPDANGRKWFECDIDYEGGYRGAKRIVYSNDGLIYYTDDHYESFEQLY